MFAPLFTGSPIVSEQYSLGSFRRIFAEVGVEYAHGTERRRKS
jgi:hypothetical protein